MMGGGDLQRKVGRTVGRRVARWTFVRWWFRGMGGMGHTVGWFIAAISPLVASPVFSLTICLYLYCLGKHLGHGDEVWVNHGLFDGGFVRWRCMS